MNCSWGKAHFAWLVIANLRVSRDNAFKILFFICKFEALLLCTRPMDLRFPQAYIVYRKILWRIFKYNILHHVHMSRTHSWKLSNHWKRAIHHMNYNGPPQRFHEDAVLVLRQNLAEGQVGSVCWLVKLKAASCYGVRKLRDVWGWGGGGRVKSNCLVKAKFFGFSLPLLFSLMFSGSFEANRRSCRW